MVSLSVRKLAATIIWFALLISCGDTRHELDVAEVGKCPALGNRVHLQKLDGIIYSDIKTRVHIPACLDTEMALAFIGEPAAEYVNLKNRAEREMTMVGFSALADGFVVRESKQRYTFIALTMDDVLQNPRLVPAGEKDAGHITREN